MKHSLLLQLGSLALLTAACTSTTTHATSNDYDDVAQALSGAVATTDHGGEAGSFYDAAQISVGTPPLGLAIDASGKFAGKHANLSYAYKTTCADASGASLPACGLTTDSSTVEVTWSGNLMTPNLTASIDHQASLRLTGLHSGTVTVSGDGNFEVDSHFSSAWRQIERTYHLGYSARYDAVQLHGLPLLAVGGTIHYTVDAERKTSSDAKKTEAAFRIDATIEFAGDGSAKITLDDTHHYTVDMASGAVVKSN